MSKAVVGRSGHLETAGRQLFGCGLQIRSAERDDGALGVLSWYARPTAICGMDNDRVILEILLSDQKKKLAILT
jgi:hypothetical protein